MISTSIIARARTTTPVIHLEPYQQPLPNAIATIVSCRCGKYVMPIAASLAGRVSNFNDEIRLEYKGVVYKTFVSSNGVFHVLEKKDKEGKIKLVLQKERTNDCWTCSADPTRTLPAMQG